jgi:DNA-binding beta-propeller fold protein YncE
MNTSTNPARAFARAISAALLTVLLSGAAQAQVAYLPTGEHTLLMVSLATNRVLASVLTGTDPRGVAVTAHKVYVTNIGAGECTVTVISLNPDPTKISAKNISVCGNGEQPYAIAASPDGTRVYVALTYGDSIRVILKTAVRQ